jgi:hypothetical protein
VTQPFGVRAQWLWLLRFLECHIKGAMAGRCIYRGSRLTAALWSRIVWPLQSQMAQKL